MLEFLLLELLARAAGRGARERVARVDDLLEELRVDGPIRRERLVEDERWAFERLELRDVERPATPRVPVLLRVLLAVERRCELRFDRDADDCELPLDRDAVEREAVWGAGRRPEVNRERVELRSLWPRAAVEVPLGRRPERRASESPR